MKRWIRAAKAALVACVAGGTILAGAAWGAGSPSETAMQVSRAELTIDGHSLAVFGRCMVASDIDPDRQEIRCERGVTRNIELAAWHELVRLGDMAAAEKSFSLTMYDVTGDPVLRWHATDGFPTELTVYFDKQGYGREIVTFTAEFIQRVSV